VAGEEREDGEQTALRESDGRGRKAEAWRNDSWTRLT